MRAINITISAQEEQRLQNLVLFSPNVLLRTRCRIILLRAMGIATKDIADFVGLKPQSVNRWLKAYIQDGLSATGTQLSRPNQLLKCNCPIKWYRSMSLVAYTPLYLRTICCRQKLRSALSVIISTAGTLRLEFWQKWIFLICSN